MVDSSHGNSGKDHRRQPAVAADVAAQVGGGERAIIGVMLESFLPAGRQDRPATRPGWPTGRASPTRAWTGTPPRTCCAAWPPRSAAAAAPLFPPCWARPPHQRSNHPGDDPLDSPGYPAPRDTPPACLRCPERWQSWLHGEVRQRIEEPHCAALARPGRSARGLGAFRGHRRCVRRGAPRPPAHHRPGPRGRVGPAAPRWWWSRSTRTRMR